MQLKKNIFLLLATVLVAGCSGSSSNSPSCATNDQCVNDPKCQCWCSVKCGYRKKTSADRPVYITDDPNGKGCYCKQWDLDNYDTRCGSNKDMMNDQEMMNDQQMQMQKKSNY